MPGLLLYGSLHGCDIRIAEDLKRRMMLVASRCNFVVMGDVFVQFQPFGATGALVLAESHFTAHTWPELFTVDVDVHCCSKDFNPDECARVVLEEFGGASMSYKIALRDEDALGGEFVICRAAK